MGIHACVNSRPVSRAKQLFTFLWLGSLLKCPVAQGFGHKEVGESGTIMSIKCLKRLKGTESMIAFNFFFIFESFFFFSFNDFLYITLLLLKLFTFSLTHTRIFLGE